MDNENSKISESTEELNNISDFADEESDIKMSKKEKLAYIKSKVTEHKKLAILISIAVLIAIGFMAKGIAKEAELYDIYNNAVTLMENGEYEEAHNLFLQLKDRNIGHTDIYIPLSKACYYYSEGWEDFAYCAIEKVEFVGFPKDERERLNEFKKKLENAYRLSLIEVAAQNERNYNKRVSSAAVPFVEMQEDDIGKTGLGSPSATIRHDYEYIGKYKYKTNIYDFIKDDELIFVASCVLGKVTKVSDYRDNPIKLKKSKSKSKSKKKKKNPGKYNVNEYSNVDDFYFDYSGFFEDYEDAEDFYNRYHEEGD